MLKKIERVIKSRKFRNLVTGEAIPVTGRGGPGCETSRVPHFLENRLKDGGKFATITCPLHQGRFLVVISVRGFVEPRAIVRLGRLG
jgi:hypothetical protein